MFGLVFFFFKEKPPPPVSEPTPLSKEIISSVKSVPPVWVSPPLFSPPFFLAPLPLETNLERAPEWAPPPPPPPAWPPPKMNPHNELPSLVGRTPGPGVNAGGYSTKALASMQAHNGGRKTQVFPPPFFGRGANTGCFFPPPKFSPPFSNEGPLFFGASFRANAQEKKNKIPVSNAPESPSAKNHPLGFAVARRKTPPRPPWKTTINAFFFFFFPPAPAGVSPGLPGSKKWPEPKRVA